MGAETWCFKEYRFTSDLTEFVLETVGSKDFILYGARVDSEINEALKKRGIEGWHRLVPYFRGYNYVCLEKGEKDYIEECLSGQPQRGLEFVETNNVAEIIQNDLPNHIEYLQFVIDSWKEGYFLFLDY